MSTVILVAFASRYGTTRQVAETIGTVLGERGFDVDLQPVSQVRSLEGFRAVVLGAGLQVGAWQKDAHHFLEEFRQPLGTQPVAVFTLGPLHANEREMQASREQLDRELSKHPWLTPAAKEVFVGKFDPGQLHFPMNLVPALKNMPAADEMNWDEIRGWARDLPKILGLEQPADIFHPPVS